MRGQLSDQGGFGTERHWIDLGDVAVVPLIEIPRLLIDPQEFFPEIGTEREGWWFERPWYDEELGCLVYTIQSFLLLTPVGTVIVDGCVGAAKSRRRREFDRQGDMWLRRLQESGVQPTDVSDVVLTHLHVDHVGWATTWNGQAWIPTFPTARHHVTEEEFTYWTSAVGRASTQRTGDYMGDSVQPVRDSGLLSLTTADAAINDRVRLVPAPGHTPGNVCVEVRGSTERLLLTGDTAHHPLQLQDPSRSTRYCVQPETAATTRRRLLGDASDSGTPILPSHFATPSVGRVSRDATAFTFTPAPELIRFGRPGIRI